MSTVETREPTKKRPESFGKIVQIVGPVLDVAFEEGHLPEIYDALRISREDGTEIVAEVQQHLGNSWVRAVAMDTSDGLRRGMKVLATANRWTARDR